MKKIAIKIMLGLSSILLFIPVIAFATKGTYIEAQVGKASSTQSFIFGSQTGSAGRVAVGYLLGENKFNYGLELGYLIYPHLSGEEFFFFEDKISGYNADLLAVLKYKFDSNIVIFAKDGVAYTSQKVAEQFEYSNTTYHYQRQFLSNEFALGIGYQLSPKVEINLTASTTTRPYSKEEDSANVSALLLGMSYSF